MIFVNSIRPLSIFWIILCLPFAAKAQPSVLHAGNWYKLAVEKNAVYKVDFGFLKKMGIDPDKVDPRTIKIYGNPGGMLPQANSADRPVDLTEIAIAVNGEGDGVFNKEDYILFYGQDADQRYFDVGKQTFFYEKNLYADKNYYFLTISDGPGKRIGNNENSGVGLPIVKAFDDFIYHELDNYNDLQSGRDWFGENFYLNSQQTFSLDISGITDNSTIQVISDVMAQSTTGSSFKLYVNDIQLGEQFISPIPDTQYGVKGIDQLDTLRINSNMIAAVNASTMALRYNYIKQADYSIGYLDYFLVSFNRKLQLYGNQTIFRSGASLKNTASQFQIDQLSNNCTVWEITDVTALKNQPFSLVNGTGIFSAGTTQLREFIVFNAAVPTPEFIGAVSNQDLHSVPTPTLLIVTYPDFTSEAKRFADYRQNHSNCTAVVVTPEEIYNEFSSGRQDVTAIRDFIKYLYDKNPAVLKSLVLFGRASYDYKDRLPNNTNFIPTYESRNSLDPLATYSSDDFYTFLENTEGNWGENPPENHTLDISVGRFPVKTLEEAKNIVDKIIDYETNPKSFGRWRKEITFVADDGDNNTHQSQADQLAKKIETAHPEFNAKRIFLDAYPQATTPAGQYAPEVNKAILDAIDRGSLVINYTGHGGEQIWAQEKIFDNIMIENMDNKTYPLFVTATCDFGRSDDPADISSAELAVIRKYSGAIGMVTTARPVGSSTNFELNQAFYDAFFTKEANAYLTLGEIFRRTKNNSTSGVSNRNFSLLGDPTLRLAIPTYGITVNSIKNDEGTDSIKALSTITISGEIYTPVNQKATDFSGILDATLFDKQATFTTLGDENPPFSYTQWYNTIFRGSATVKKGDFELKFITTKNIAYQVGQGKLSLYAYDDKRTTDAIGSDLNFVVGKSNQNPAADDTSPFIRVFMGDTTFVNGGAINSDTYLVAEFQDNSGINISGYGIGNSIIGSLDNGESFVLNDYYDANTNDFTKGQIVYRMQGLSSGKHTLLVKAWDTHNNPGQAMVTFTVTDGNDIKMEAFGNYPNPVRSTTTLFFTHNHAGDDLEATVYFYDFTGHILKTFDFSIYSSNYKVELPEIDIERDFAEKLSSGLYLARLLVRSLSDNSKNERVAKLIVLN